MKATLRVYVKIVGLPFEEKKRIAYLMLDSVTRLVGEDTNLLVCSSVCLVS